MSDTLIGTWAGDVNPETKADILHSEVTSAIYRADQLGIELVNAWLEVAEVERKLANFLPDGPEKRIAVRGVERAEQQANKIKEFDSAVKRLSIIFGVCLFVSLPVYSQIAAAGWCVVQSSNQSESDQSNNEPPDDSFPPQEDDQPTTTSLGCDIGLGFSLYTYKNRLAIVAVVDLSLSGLVWHGYLILGLNQRQTIGQLWQ